jgi:hypothetical protein
MGLLGLICIGASGASETSVCRADCLIQVEGLHAEYAEPHVVTFVLRNTSQMDLSYNAELDAQVRSNWQSLVASIEGATDPKATIVRLIPLPRGTSRSVSFSPWDWSSRGWVRGKLTLRLRLSVHSSRGPEQYIDSVPFVLGRS